MQEIKSAWLIFLVTVFLCCINVGVYAKENKKIIFAFQEQLFDQPILKKASRSIKKRSGSATTVGGVESNYFHLKISKPLSIDASVDYETRDGTAKAGIDYIASSGTLTILAGQTSLDIGVGVLIPNSDKNFSLVISNPIGAKFPDGKTEIIATHTITNTGATGGTTSNSISIAQPYTKQAEIDSTLIDPPEGMTINPKTGLITWTPTPNQVGDISFEVQSGDAVEVIELKVKEADFNNSNIVFISPNGNNDNNGSYDAPLENTKKLCTNIDDEHPDLTIYFRGGIYHNPNFGDGGKNNPPIPQIKCSGTKNHRINIKPWGNEKPKIEYDSATAFRLTGHYINIEGFEIKGVGDKISYKEAVSNWWRGDNYYNGNAIAVNGHHVDIKNNILSYIPAQAISVKRADYVTIENNIVYNSAWWSVGGTNAMSINDSIIVDDADVTHHKFIGNLIFGVESRIYSRVWKKGFAHLTIDEGGGILAQINAGNYTGRYLIENNMVLFTGKGIIANKTHKVDMLHNTIYNSGTTMTGGFRGLRGNDADDSNFKFNAIKIVDNEGMTLSLSQDTKNIESQNNCAIKGDKDKFTDGFTYVDKLFTNPTALDFSIDSSNACNKTVGVPSSVWSSMKQRAKEYGIEIKPSNYVVNYEQQSQDIVNAIPQSATIDWSEYNESEPSHIMVTNLPNDIEGRPSSFRLDFVHPFKRIDIANKYGKASQGTQKGYQYYSPASYAIDNNDSTYNHTRGGSKGENWLQIELPSPTKISKIVLQNRSHASRLTNAKVYLSDAPFTGTVDEADLIQTLQATTDEQVIDLASPKSGTYLLIKGEQRPEDDRHIHLIKVEVYGEMPIAPAIVSDEKEFLIKGTSEQGSVVATINTVDYQEDALIYSIVGEVPFSIDSQGNVSVNGSLSDNVYTFDVQVSDGINSTMQTITINVTSDTVIADVLASGDVVTTKVTEEELIQATLDEIEASKTYLQDEKIKIFNLNTDGTAKDDGSSLTSIDWNPTHDASLLASTLGQNVPLLYTNAVGTEGYAINKKPLAIIGEKANAKYLVFGANPLRVEGNSEMNQLLENAMAWLTGRDNLKTDGFKVVIAHLDESYWFKDESQTRAWLDSHFAGQVTYNSENSCDNSALPSCLDSNTDLLIISQISGSGDDLAHITATVNKALDDGISVLYVHNDGGYESLGKALFSSVFDVVYTNDNYWHRLSLEGYNAQDDMNILSPDLAKVKTMFTHFKNRDYAFDWSKCKDKDGVYGEKGNKCSEVPTLQSDFQDGANFVRTLFTRLDQSKKDIFKEEGYRLQKLLALTADKFRQSVSYPMGKVTTDDTTFMKSFYSDHALYNFRKINPKQLDMGNFSRSDFSHISPTTRVVNLKSKRSFRSTGAYALPGESVKITRTDNADVKVKVFINTLRPGATHHYDPNKYNRPKYLKTPHIEIKSGESMEITSPYGGPIQLEFNKNDLNVSLTFENVGEHPYWASSADNTSFEQKMEAEEYDWAEIATAGFEVHSKLTKMKESISDTRWGGTAEGLAAAVVKYTSNYPHVLAGFKGEGVDVVPEIHDWANAKGLTIETIDKMKHMNSDQAACGYGCSGNPYDAFWAFNPIGHGDIHEMGHSMQKMRFENFPNHAATNTFSYYTKARYFADTGIDPNCQGLPFKSFFETIQASVGQADIATYLKTNLWDTAGLGEQYLLKIQAMMHAQKLGKLKNGWHVLARVHILEREMKRAKQDWEAKKASVGFSTYSLDEINSIRNNDWLMIAYSYASELDLRNYFTMMGMPHSDKAYAQIASFGFEVAPNSLFVSTTTGYCKTDAYGTIFNRPTLPIDGSTAYSY